MVQPPQKKKKKKTRKNIGEGWYFLFDYSNDMSYKYHLFWMGQLNTYNPIYCKENKEGNREN